jgi:hypothetical protein
MRSKESENTEKTIRTRFLKKRVDETRCPSVIRDEGVTSEHVFMLRERIECGDWKHVKDCFVRIKGKHILSEPVAARAYLTIHPEQVVEIMEREGIW